MGRHRSRTAQLTIQEVLSPRRYRGLPPGGQEGNRGALRRRQPHPKEEDGIVRGSKFVWNASEML
jgi:hypothetical protein